MKTLKFTTRFLAIASFSLISTCSIGQIINENLLCEDVNGTPIEGTPVWTSSTGQIVTTSVCPTNTKIGIQVSSPEANLHLHSNLDPSYSQTVFLIENNQEKILKISNSGVMYTREIRVNLDQWPDYVFEEEYELISLDSLENYINQEGHLPNVPAAEAVENDGLNLGESNKFLMEKVEELTLYLIAQNKEQEQLKATLEEQQKLLQAQQELLIQQSLLIQQIVANLK